MPTSLFIVKVSAPTDFSTPCSMTIILLINRAVAIRKQERYTYILRELQGVVMYKFMSG